MPAWIESAVSALSVSTPPFALFAGTAPELHESRCQAR